MTRVELSKELNLTKAQVYYREKVLGIIGQDYTEKNIELIRNKRNFKKKDRKFLSPVKFEIINSQEVLSMLFISFLFFLFDFHILK